MTTTATRKVVIAFTGDINYAQSFASVENDESPAAITLLDLAAGANTITVPDGGATAKGATIIPPILNDVAITLKGVSGDTGIAISMTDPTSIAFETAPASFVLTAGDVIEGLRIVWT